MLYMGGKQRIAKQLGHFISLHTINRHYYEPFIGGANVIRYIYAKERYASDANTALITMWNAVCNHGWIPPENVSEEEYNAIKRGCRNPYDPLTAVVGFGCSFGGKWFKGYARRLDGERNYALHSKNSILKKLPQLKGVHWRYGGYDEQTYTPNSVIYCDPPYANTTGYNAVSKFNHQDFYNWCRRMHNEGHTVFISEYDIPEDFKCVLEIKTKTEIRTKVNGREDRVERLYTL